MIAKTLVQLNGRTPEQALEELVKTRKSKHKYGAVREGRYASKAEARYAAELGMRQRAANGDVEYWLEQVAIPLPGGIKYICDFLVFLRDGSHVYVETKGHETRVWINKLKQLQELRPEIAKRLEIVR